LKRLYERADRSGIRFDLLNTVEDIMLASTKPLRPRRLTFPVIVCIR